MSSLGPDELGATVITNLFSAIPVVGGKIVTLLWGGFSVDNPTLNRFFSLHYLLPFVILGVVVIHVIALHRFGSNNPIGIDTKGEQDGIPFHPYYTVKDLFGMGVFFIFFAFWVFYAPTRILHNVVGFLVVALFITHVYMSMFAIKGAVHSILDGHMEERGKNFTQFLV